jgi:uncharacterized membrane protein YkvA (DUF1232 family)
MFLDDHQHVEPIVSVWKILLGATCSMLVAWLLLVVLLFFLRPKGSLVQEAARLLPDVLQLLRRLSTDRSLPKGVRIRLWLLFAYLAMPIDLVPDFLPVIGYADDAIIVCAVLRSIVRRAGPDSIRRHWPGTQDGLAVLWRAAALPEDSGAT